MCCTTIWYHGICVGTRTPVVRGPPRAQHFGQKGRTGAALRLRALRSRLAPPCAIRGFDLAAPLSCACEESRRI